MFTVLLCSQPEISQSWIQHWLVIRFKPIRSKLCNALTNQRDYDTSQEILEIDFALSYLPVVLFALVFSCLDISFNLKNLHYPEQNISCSSKRAYCTKPCSTFFQLDITKLFQCWINKKLSYISQNLLRKNNHISGEHFIVT